MRARTAGVLILLTAAFAAPALAGFAGTDLFIPMAGRGVGAYPSNWFTTVYLYNPNATAVSVDLTFLERNKDNVATAPPRVTDTLAAGETKVYDNIVEATFGETGTVYGAIRIQCTQKVVATSRVFSKESESAPLTQTFGQDFAATPAAFAIGLGEASDILGGYTTQPYQDSAARFNIGCVETTGAGSATVRWIARDAAGQQQKSYDRTVPRLSQTQGFFHDYFTGVDLTNARISANVIAGSGKVICYGSLVTNDKEFPKPVQDPTTFEMVYPEKVLGATTVQHDATLTGDGTVAAPLGLADGAVSQGKLSATGGTAGQVLGTNGTVLLWQGDGLKLPFAGEATSDGHVLAVTNQGAGQAVVGNSPVGTGVLGMSAAGSGVHGVSVAGDGVVGQATAVGKAGVLGSNPDPGGWAGAFLGSVAVTGDLACEGCVHEGDMAEVSVGSGQLVDGAVTDAKVAGGIAYAKIVGTPTALPPSGPAGNALRGSYPNPDLAENSVGTGHILDGAVGWEKLAAVGGSNGQVLALGDGGIKWQDDAFKVPLSVWTNDDFPFMVATLAPHSFSNNVALVGAHTTADAGLPFLSYPTGVYGYGYPGFGVAGYGQNGGVRGYSDSKAGVWGDSRDDVGVYGTSTNSYAGYFDGDVYVRGSITAGAKPFAIDHPLDPANKVLNHVAVESPDMMDIYNGNVVTDADGLAVVELPAYFEALNGDFRYQLTVIGKFAQAIVEREVEDNRFTIRTNLGDTRVSWQVTGIRHDGYARAHRVPVEVDKPEAERGTYLHPEAFGEPEERGVAWVRHPEAMQRMKPTDGDPRILTRIGLPPAR